MTKKQDAEAADDAAMIERHRKRLADAGAVHNINPQLLSLARPIGTFKADPNNARKHGEHDLKVLAQSFKNYGQNKTVVALADGTIIAGSGTLVATRDILKWTHLAAVVFAVEDAAKAKAFALADNRTAELSSWDFDQLSETLRELPNELVIDIGFSAKDLASFLVDPSKVSVAGSESHTREIHLGDMKFGTTCPKCGFEFDPKTGAEK